MNTLGRALRERRVVLGLSQEALAELTGVSARSINRWEQDRAAPQPAPRRRLAEVLGLDPADLIPTLTDPFGANSTTPLAWHVPLRRNPFFTGREAVLAELHASLTPTGPAPSVQALTGLPGIGKTQTALEYAYRYGHRYRAVFWIGAGGAGECRAGLTDLAGILGLHNEGANASFSRTLAVLREWFRRNAGWLLVLDNLEDARLLEELGLSGCGAILVTTCSQAIGASGGRVELAPLSTDEGVALLSQRGRIALSATLQEPFLSAESAAARTLVMRLGRLPLALDQAGAYLEETGCGVATYLELFDTQQHALLARRGRLAVQHPDSVDATLSLAFRHIVQINAAAAELLCLCAFLHPDSIPEELLSAGSNALGPTLGPVIADPLRLDEAIADLASLSLVRRDRRSHAISVHRLVQDVVRFALTTDEQRTWATRAVHAVAKALPAGDTFHFGTFLRLLPQSTVAVELIERWQLHTLDAAVLIERLGAFHQQAGDYVDSRRLLLCALRLRKRLQPRDHLDIAETRTYLAELALSLGDFARAETLARAALQQRQAQLPASDARVAQAMRLLGRVCIERGAYPLAESLVRQALQLQVDSLGDRQPQVAETLGLLAEIAFMRGNYQQTEEMLGRALAINETVLGPTHLMTAYSLEALGTLYRYWGRDAQAEAHFRRALPILIRSLGGDHPMVLTVLNGLARAKLGQGQISTAEVLARRALRLRETLLGPDHPKLAYSLQALCEILLAQGRVAEAEPLARRGLAIRDRVHGERHPSVSISLDILAQIRDRQGEAAEAEELYRRALTILERTAGSSHPRLLELRARYDQLTAS